MFLNHLSGGWIDNRAIIVVDESIEWIQFPFVIVFSTSFGGLLLSVSLFPGFAVGDVSVGGISSAHWEVFHLDHLWVSVMMLVVAVMSGSGGESPWLTSWLLLGLWLTLLLLLTECAWSPDLMEPVTTLVLLGKSVSWSIRISDIVLESLEILLVSLLLHIGNEFLKSLSFGVGDSVTSLLVEAVLTLALFLMHFWFDLWKNIDGARVGSETVDFLVHLRLSNISAILLGVPLKGR